ncbi:MAG TPA: lipoprotein insertase outer membrane protein LolB [Casimicrobiaceae bacterium]|nr:lipoprotein insertase outer membrane protein LolB [Casimicrobiaceae bacterium]
MILRIPRGSSRACALIIVALLSACAQMPAQVPTRGPVPTANAFTAAGRISARHGSEGVAGHFDWTHTGDRDDIALATPLGQQIARLDGDASQVRIELPDGRVASAADWDALTRTELGSPIPVRGLSAWLLGAARSDSPSNIERDAQGRSAVLRQDGWEVVYGYADDASRTPARLTLRYAADPTIEVRLAIDQWQ